MYVLSLILIGLVALEHLYFMYLEMFVWTRPKTRSVFGTTAEFAEASKSLAANQGLYNGFLAAGLLWSLIESLAYLLIQNNLVRCTRLTEAGSILHLKIFFLACVITAAIYGAVSVKRSILYVQGGPAILALVTVLLAG